MATRIRESLLGRPHGWNVDSIRQGTGRRRFRARRKPSPRQPFERLGQRPQTASREKVRQLEEPKIQPGSLLEDFQPPNQRPCFFARLSTSGRRHRRWLSTHNRLPERTVRCLPPSPPPKLCLITSSSNPTQTDSKISTPATTAPSSVSAGPPTANTF